MKIIDRRYLVVDAEKKRILMREDTGPEEWSLAELQAAGKALHCFTTAPGFVDAENHDYHLTADSPCIDAGIGVGLLTDFEGNPIR